MLKSFSDFLFEGISYTRGGYGTTMFQVEQLPPQTIEELKKKTGLKKGDPVKFTGNRNLLQLRIDRWGHLFTEVVKGEKVNQKGLLFDRWLNQKELKELKNLAENVPIFSGFYQKPFSTLSSALLAYCKDSRGEEDIYSFFTYNPDYVKSTPKVPEIFTPEELEALCEKVLAPAGITFVVEKSPFKPGKWQVSITTYYVAVTDNVGESRVAGPFGTKEAAEKRMKELGDVQGGDLDMQLLKDLNVRIDARRTPSDFFIRTGHSDISDLEFTRTLKKRYNTEELLKMMRGKITGKKFNI